MAKSKLTLLERFMSRVEIQPNGCWYWTGTIDRDGYGRNYVYPGRNYLAHRLSYELHIGPITDGLIVDHTCHDPAYCIGGLQCLHRRCVRPDHLNQIPHGDNMSRLRRVMRNRDAFGPKRTPSTGIVRKSLEERLLFNVEVSDDDCWLWTGYVNKDGYGLITYNGRSWGAHRIAYEHFVGEIPSGLLIDHQCHDPLTCSGGNTCLHRRCINPKHLLATTKQVNCSNGRSHNGAQKAWPVSVAVRTARTHCPSGHEYTKENTYVYRRCRSCKECARNSNRERRRAKKISANPVLHPPLT